MLPLGDADLHRHDGMLKISQSPIRQRLPKNSIFIFMKVSFVYIITNKHRTTLYIGVTSNLCRRISEHQNGYGSAFTKKYNLTDLIYFEEFSDIKQAIKREKQLKEWQRAWKLRLIKEINPKLETLSIL